jgi:hypothetical protein
MVAYTLWSVRKLSVAVQQKSWESADDDDEEVPRGDGTFRRAPSHPRPFHRHSARLASGLDD